jgi:hypothetical protein
MGAVGWCVLFPDVPKCSRGQAAANLFPNLFPNFATERFLAFWRCVLEAKIQAFINEECKFSG